MTLKLRFQEYDVQKFALRYDYQISEKELIEMIPVVYAKRYLDKKTLQKLAYWKAPRSSGHVNKNDDE